MPQTTTAGRQHRPVRAGRSRTWTALTTALIAMAIAFIALMALEISNFATTNSPMITIADARGPTDMVLVTLTKEQFVTSGANSVTLRVRNDSAEPVNVAVTLTAGTTQYGGTLTAGLTMDGAVVRSGALHSLHIPSLMLDATSTTPLTLELDVDTEELDALWAANGDLTLAVAATTAP